MNFNNEITLLIVIYNRPTYTLNWIENAIKKKIPFNILIADAGNNSNLRKKIKNKIKSVTNCKYLKCKYFPPHSENYFLNFSYATKKIKTKYTYICEDDDFIVPENIIKSAKFLEKNSEFIVSGGQNINMTLRKNSLLNYSLFNTEQIFRVKDLNQKDFYSRINKYLDGKYISHWNCLHRTKKLKKNNGTH